MPVLEVVQGDITTQRVDAIVTAANESLLGGAGVDGAIHRAAGPALAEAAAKLAPCAPGEAVATPAFDLARNTTHILHTVGPLWQGGTDDEQATLTACYRNTLSLADTLDVRTIAFPAIATGSYGYPLDEAARIAVTTLSTTPTKVTAIRLIAFDQATHEALTRALAAQP
ncbi:O-acetyl-ADP-ribose deacetylase (regulator of RNase III) [Crossiella equi]|uniref:O-acetyl-ADP-ribose deacetylase (Regulator of RNase III) n=1 Tax=Crossiella equi TaxID=130796 RepID=A0ABS5A9R2_9PSEU|nr:macro domain-containing protein [Crossiella equi]MBP2473325.1 O-acetyl-ADP-ribose deacetylase (regulator of RNase III) [Crossiella equi]